jgi:hypothetical protein
MVPLGFSGSAMTFEWLGHKKEAWILTDERNMAEQPGGFSVSYARVAGILPGYVI